MGFFSGDHTDVPLANKTDHFKNKKTFIASWFGFHGSNKIPSKDTGKS